MDWVDIIVPIITALIGAFATYLVQKNLQEKRDIERRLSEKRHEMYMEVLDIFIGSIIGEYDAQQIREKAFSKERKKKNFDLALIGEDSVIKAYNELLDYSIDLKQDEKIRKKYEEIRLFARLLLEIRKSLGYKKTKLTDVDILRPFIKDANKLRES